jgi:hypothetical protein
MRCKSLLPSCVLLVMTGCGASQSTRYVEPQSNDGKISAEIQLIAESALGKGGEVFATGDFANNGHQQAIVMNRLASTKNQIPGVLFSRAAIVQKDGRDWTEVLRCDEYLKNSAGYLSAVPAAGWRLEFPTLSGGSRTFKFTPLQAYGADPAANAPAPAIDVRWNPGVRRYQVFAGVFQTEIRMLETPASVLR